MKTYLLKYPVYNSINFPVGTTVIITDDYWGGRAEPNTSFTVVKGKLKGEKGCVANGLSGYLIDDTKENRLAIKNHLETLKKL